MILDNIVKMTWNSNNKKYYVQRGYIYTKMFEEFDVNIYDINEGSNKKVSVKCDVCGKIKFLPIREYNVSVNNGGYYSCSQKCSNDKSKQTCLKIYGVEVPLLSETIKKKTRKTNLEKFGCEYASQNIKIKEKVKRTCLINLGTEYAFQNEMVKDKTKQTCLEKYGVGNIFQSEQFKDKCKQTCLEKYGVENPFQSEIIKEKIKKTNLKKYGFEYATQNKEISNKIINTIIEKYGEIWKNHIQRYNPNSIIYLDIISNKMNLIILHALNGGEKKFIKYWVDGYIQDFNICIEWDEESHNLEHDKKKDEYLKNNFGCEIIRVREKIFLKNIDNEIDNIIDKINHFINL